MIKILNINPLPNYKLHIKYNDGVEGDLDLSNLVGKGVFEKFDDINYFKNVKIGQFGEPCWNDELDIDPTSAYLDVTGKTYEQYLKEKTH